MKKIKIVLILIGIVLIATSGIIIITNNKGSTSNSSNEEKKEDDKKEIEKETEKEKSKYEKMLNRNVEKLTKCYNDYGSGNKKEYEIKNDKINVVFNFFSCGTHKNIDDGIEINIDDTLSSQFKVITVNDIDEYLNNMEQTYNTTVYPFKSVFRKSNMLGDDFVQIVLYNNEEVINVERTYLHKLNDENIYLKIYIESAIEFEEGAYEDIISSVKIK